MKNISGIDETASDGFRIVRSAWDDMKFSLVGVNPPGAASDPSIDTSDGILVFSASQDNIITGAKIVSHAWAIGTPAQPHIHWMPATTGSGNVVWKFEARSTNRNAVYGAFDFTAEMVVPAGGVANKHLVTEFGEWDLSDGELAFLLSWKLTRLATDPRDTYAGTVKVVELDFHMLYDSIGSEEEFSKEALDG